MRDQYSDIRTMNETFGNPAIAKSKLLEGGGWEEVTTQAKCLLDEVNTELMQACENKDITELRDVIGDILVFTLGLAHLANVDVCGDLDAIFESNMSKLVVDADMAEETIMKYRKKGVVIDIKGHYPEAYAVSVDDQFDKEGKFYPRGKFLKGAGFREPEFAPYDEAHDEAR